MKVVNKVNHLDARELQYMEALLYFGDEAGIICEYSFEDSELFLNLLAFGYSLADSQKIMSNLSSLDRETVLDMVLANAQVCVRPMDLIDALQYNEDKETVRTAMRMGLSSPDFLKLINKENVMLLIRAKNYGYCADEVGISDPLEIRKMLINTSILEETNNSKIEEIETWVNVLDNEFDENSIEFIRSLDDYQVEFLSCNLEQMVEFNEIDEFIKPLFDVVYKDTGVVPTDEAKFISCTPETESTPEFHYDENIWEELEKWDHYSVGSF